MDDLNIFWKSSPGFKMPAAKDRDQGWRGWSNSWKEDVGLQGKVKIILRGLSGS